MPENTMDCRADHAAILVRVSPDILRHMADGDVEPVVILGVRQAEDGTYEMLLKTPPPQPEDFDALRAELDSRIEEILRLEREWDMLNNLRLDERERVYRLRGELEVLRDACGHCLAAGRPPNQQMIDNADAAIRRIVDEEQA